MPARKRNSIGAGKVKRYVKKIEAKEVTRVGTVNRIKALPVGERKDHWPPW